MTEHCVSHRYKEEILLPICAIRENIIFLTNEKEEKFIIFADGIKRKVLSYRTIHICEMEDYVKRLYDMNAWDFIKRWYDNGNKFYTSEFVHIKVENNE